MELKKLYYYVICLVALLMLGWGLVDLASASVGLVSARMPAISSEKDGELDIYYQKKVLYDRLSDSLARIIISGIIFAYSRTKVARLEK